MTIKSVMTAEEHAEVDPVIQELYSERDGSYELTGIQGAKSEADFRRQQVALEKERGDHKSTKARLKPWGDMDYDETMGILDRQPELEAAAAGSIDEDKLQELAESKANTRVMPLERELAKFRETVLERDATIQNYETKEITRVVTDALRKVGKETKMIDAEDMVVYGKSHFTLNEHGEILTKEGLGVEQFAADLQHSKGHLWGSTSGGGAQGSNSGGGGGINPFTHENWDVTQQMAMIGENPERAEAKRRSAGAGTSLDTISRPAAKKS